MKRHLRNALAIAVFVAGATLVDASQNVPAVAGKWRMTIEFPDESRPAGLDLQLEGRKITGRFIASFAGGEIPVEGSLLDDKVTFSGTTSGGPHPATLLEFGATLKDDTLTGSMSTPFGEFRWTAERLEGANGH